MAVVCAELNKDLLRSTSCGYSLPQIVTLYLANFADVKATALSEQKDEISGITMVNEAKFYVVEPAKNSASFTDEYVTNDNGAQYRTQTITFSVTGQYDKDKHNALDALSLGQYFVVAKTAEGNYIAFGRLKGLEASAASNAGGSANNTNGMTITLTADVTESALPLTQEAINTVIGAGA